MAKEDVGPSDAAVPVNVVPVTETPNGSDSSMPVVLSSSGVVALAQLVPDNAEPATYVMVAGIGSETEMFLAVALPELEIRIQ